MKTFRLSRAADADLRKIAEYTLHEWGVKQRDAYIKEMFRAFTQLSKTPQIAARIDFVREDYRKFPQGSHVIYFRECKGSAIEIIRVLHKKMDVGTHLNTL